MVMAESFPLQWPAGYPRTRSTRRAPYKAMTGRARDQVLHELKLMGVPDWNVIISSNVPVSERTMQMLAMRAEPADRGVAVYFRINEKPHVLACDKWDRVADNLRAIAMTVEAMRGMDRWGVSEMLERVFQGFAALPPPPDSRPKKRHWSEVIGVSPSAHIDIVEAHYRMMMKTAHPDTGGTAQAAMELNTAIQEARRERGVA